MKKLLIAAAVLVSVLGAQAQGTIDYGSQANPIFNTDGTTGLSGTGFMTQLYWAPSATGTYTAIGNPVSFFTGGGAGFWNPGNQGVLTVTGQPGGTVVSVVARAWDVATGATYDAASSKGASAPLTITLGGAGAPPSLPADLSGLAGFKLTGAAVPEPSTIALGLLGAGALLLRRRK